MIEKKIDSLRIWFFENLLRCEGISHFVSTRVGGHSSMPCNSLNLGFNLRDDAEKVLKNRKVLAEALGIPAASLTTAKQIHDCHVKIVTEELRGKGAFDYTGAINATDALVTDAADICLTVLLADCVPILLYDPAKRVVGVVHAGWNGTLRLIAQETVMVFRKHFGSSSQDILAGIGPSIGPCCFQVGPEVSCQVKDIFGTEQDYIRNKSADGRGYLDLWTANMKQLVGAGIPEENIELAKVCTCDHVDLFFSHRCEKGRTGRFGAGIAIR